MIRVTAPDGSFVDFPDGTPDDTMAAAMRDRFGGKLAEPKPDPMRVTTRFFQGFNKPLGDVLLGLPVLAERGTQGAYNAVADAAGLPQWTNPGYSSRLLNSYRETFTAQEPAQNRAERMAESAGRMVLENLPATAAAIMSGGASVAPQTAAEIATAAGASGRAPAIWQNVKEALRAMTTQAAERPLVSAGQDTAAALGAGAMQQLGAEKAVEKGWSPEIGGTVGALAGSTLPVMSRFATPTSAVLSLPGGETAAKYMGQVTKPLVDRVATHLPGAETIAQRGAARGQWANREGAYAPGEALENAPMPEATRFERWFDNALRASQATSDAVASSRVKDSVEKGLATPEAKVNLAEADAIAKDIPGFNPTLAQKTGDQAFVNKQQEIESATTGPALRDAQHRYDATTTAVEKFRDTQVPASEDANAAVVKAARDRVDALNTKMDAAEAQTQADLKAKSDALPAVDRAAVGEEMRAIRDSEKAAADAKMSELRGAIDPTGTTRVKVGEDTFSVSDLLDKRAQINQELRDYNSATARTVDDVRRMRDLNGQLDEVNGALETVNAPGLKAYNDYYKHEYIPRFGEGASRAVGRYDKFGYDKNKVANEDVAGQFLSKDDQSAAAQAIKLYGESPRAKQLMTDYALDDLRHAAIDPTTGILKKDAVDKWLHANERVLNMPEMSFLKEAAAKANPSDLYEKLGAIEQGRRRLASNNLAKAVKEPDAMVAKALEDPALMRDLASTAEKAGAKDALLRATWDRVAGAKGDPVDVAGIEKALTNKTSRAALVEAGMTPEHLRALDTIVTATKIQKRVPRPTGDVEKTATLADEQAQFVGMSTASIANRINAISQGRQGTLVPAIEAATKFWRQRALENEAAAWREALYNGRVAETIAAAAKAPGGPTKMQLDRIYTHLITVGAVTATDNASNHGVAPKVEK